MSARKGPAGSGIVPYPVHSSRCIYIFPHVFAILSHVGWVNVGTSSSPGNVYAAVPKSLCHSAPLVLISHGASQRFDLSSTTTTRIKELNYNHTPRNSISNKMSYVGFTSPAAKRIRSTPSKILKSPLGSSRMRDHKFTGKCPQLIRLPPQRILWGTKGRCRCHEQRKYMEYTHSHPAERHGREG
jgi:hypothetical protein